MPSLSELDVRFRMCVEQVRFNTALAAGAPAHPLCLEPAFANPNHGQTHVPGGLAACASLWERVQPLHSAPSRMLSARLMPRAP